MKIHLLTLAFLTPALLPAQEANPFVNDASGQAPVVSAGAPFVNVIEHILVPADLVDPWIEQHPLNGDATALREVVGQWIVEGKATLDQSSVTTGTAGLIAENESRIEQTYATEFEPPDPGEWPFPTSFERRNIGYTNLSAAGMEGGVMSLLATVRFTRMVPYHEAWNPLVEQTREPTDIFIPRFEAISLYRSPESVAGPDPFASAPPSDPFGGGGSAPATSGSLGGIPFAPGRIVLASRTVEREPADLKSSGNAAPLDKPEAKAAAVEAKPNRKLRLVFFRGAFAQKPPLSKETPDNFDLAFKLIRVDQRAFSDWLQKSDLAALPASAWALASDWQKDGRAEVVADLSGAARSGSRSNLEDVVEVSYPTEWELSPRKAEADGKPGPMEFSNPASFETRNTGSTFEARLDTDQEGLMLRFAIQRVIQGDRSVHHRINRDGKWQADVTFPRWSVNEWKSTLRVTRGQWALVGSGTDFDAKGHLNNGFTILAFVKVE